LQVINLRNLFLPRQLAGHLYIRPNSFDGREFLRYSGPSLRGHLPVCGGCIKTQSIQRLGSLPASPKAYVEVLVT